MRYLVQSRVMTHGVQWVWKWFCHWNNVCLCIYAHDFYPRPAGIIFCMCLANEKIIFHCLGAYIKWSKGQFWPQGIVVACIYLSMCAYVHQPRACPHHNSSPIQARITKYGWEVPNTLVKIPIVFGANLTWPSRPTLISNSEFALFWACLCHNSPPFQAKITKFGSELQNTWIKILLFWEVINLDLQGQIELKIQISLVPGFGTN